MKKNYTLILIAILFAVNGVWSQADKQRYYHYSLGISGGDILYNLFNSGNDNKQYAAFVVEYAGQKYAIQAGFRPDYNTADTHHEGFLDSEVTDQLSVSGHLSFTRTIFSDDKWLIRAGLTYSGGWSREDITEDSGFDRVITRRLQWNAGLGPVLNFRFFVHPRISLGTEASLLYAVTRSELQQIFTNFPDFNNRLDTVKGNSVDVVEPSTIYLRFHF